MFNVQAIRADFPILTQTVKGKNLVYFDNAATSQKPKQVIEAIANYYETINANIHRGVHYLSQISTDRYEAARETIRKHVNAQHAFEIIFTSGTTHGINLVASGFEPLLNENDEILIGALEHHSNIVPWQFLAERTGAKLRVIPMLENGTLDLSSLSEILTEKTKVVAVNHISNALGTINPIREIIAAAHAVGAAVLIDGAQAAPHLQPDVQALDCDFYTVSGHKICAPTGSGFLYGKESWLNKMRPYQGGGEMIKEVTFEKTTYADLPHKFEAGTPNIEGGIGLGVALDYLNNIGFDKIAAQEQSLLEYATAKISAIDGARIYGPDTSHKTSVVSFNIEGVHPYDLGALLDKMGIAVRTGHHCAQPIMNFFDIPGTVRASMMFYNTFEEIDALVNGIEKAKQMLL
ncbi:aminotransferase class V-fold PLP-dependent enzyme [Flavobacterium aurantiibacter]|uniref:Cysteine desulfurase n=1 Tax=Flavobacterium aurantiibacter TaxID=2023067 RepID=A0A255ZX41_9FLAO|nr:cysteine desulfurase [Flavobacterium aurantiibacter]OYQ46117.1 cysteine desulfurase CsdA [Flavobacterium aurantiibacter]